MTELLTLDDLDISNDWVSLGSVKMRTEEMVAFASHYDPQPMHMERAAGDASLLGGLAATGWYTAAVTLRLMVDGLLSKTENHGSPGVKSLQWLKPVYPGDVLSVRYRVCSKRRSESKPHLGIVELEVETLDQAGEAVMRYLSTQFIGVTAQGSGGAP